MYKAALSVEMPYKDTISNENKQIKASFSALKKPAACRPKAVLRQMLTVCHENSLT
jgi:hypothetical protein